MYFKLNSSVYLVTGHDGGTIYDLVKNKMIHVDKKYTKELTDLDNGKELENSILPKDFIDNLIEEGVANQYATNVYIDKVRIGLPRNVKKFSSNPQRIFNLYIQLQDQCNLDCSFCKTNGNVHRITGCRKYEVDSTIDNFELYKKGMVDAHKLGCYTLHILGGEPLMSKEILTMVIDEAIRIGYINIYIYSNLYLLEEDIAKKYTKKVKFIIHIGEELQKFFQNSENCYIMKLEEKINILKKNQISYFFNICFTPQISIYKDKILSYVNGLQPEGYAYSYTYTNLDDKEYYSQICNSFLEQTKYVDEYSFFNNIDHHPCLYGKFTIFADGSIGVCPMMPEKVIGSLRNTDLSTILIQNKQDPYWNLSLDKVEGCKDCSKRYGCMDCRAVKEDITDDKKKMFCLNN